MFEELDLSSLDPLFRALYALTKVKASRSTNESRIQAGHSFEDATSQLVYSHAKECGLRAQPARQTMSFPTRSGNSYQFDAAFFHRETLYVVECKKREIPALDHVYYFGSKVLDHNMATLGKMQRIRGVFLSTVAVGESSIQFGFAFGLRILDPSNPPLEELYAHCGDNKPLRRAIRRLWEQLESVDPLKSQPGFSPQTLVKSYNFLKRRVLDPR